MKCSLTHTLTSTLKCAFGLTTLGNWDTHSFARAHTPTHAHMHTRMHTAHKHTRTHTHTHTHTHTQTVCVVRGGTGRQDRQGNNSPAGERAINTPSSPRPLGLATDA